MKAMSTAGQPATAPSKLPIKVDRINSTGMPMTIFTEGTFGILPHGLELYADGRTTQLTITGLYPINEIPPYKRSKPSPPIQKPISS